jgi:hypothetical protein
MGRLSNKNNTSQKKKKNASVMDEISQWCEDKTYKWEDEISIENWDKKISCY